MELCSYNNNISQYCKIVKTCIFAKNKSYHLTKKLTLSNLDIDFFNVAALQKIAILF